MKRLKQNRQIENRFWELVPLIIILIFVPLVVKSKIFELSGEIYEYGNGQKNSVDIFYYYKSLIVLFCSFVAILMVSTKIYNKGWKSIPSNLFTIPLAIYMVLIILSTMYSKYGDIALFGMVNKFEGMFVLLSYCILCFYTFSIVNSATKSKYLIYALMTSTFVICVIGIFQYLDMDLFRSEFGKKLMFGDNYQRVKNGIKFLVNSNSVYATISHYNYVGSFSSILVPLLLILTIYTKDQKSKFIYGGLFVMIFFILIVCSSRAGWLGSSFAFLVFLLLFAKKILKNKKTIAIVLASFLLVIIPISLLTKQAIISRVDNTFNDLSNLLDNYRNNSFDNRTDLSLQDLKLTDNEVQIKTKWESLTVRLLEGLSFNFLNENNKILTTYYVDKSQGKIAIRESEYKDYVIYMGNFNNINNVLIINRTGIELAFKIEDNKIKLMNMQGKVLNPNEPETWGFKGAETFASGRGYIWSRTIPLLKNALFLGYGADTFIFYYPQGDFFAKLKVYNEMWSYIDKPHNLFLQIALSSGVLSLIVIVVMFLIYFISSVRLYYNCEIDDEEKIYGLACFLGVCGYIMTGFFNDSIVGVAPVFWIVFGTGISMNYKVCTATNKKFMEANKRWRI
jgi:O-antigen ligase